MRSAIGLGTAGRRMTTAEFDALSCDDVDRLYHYELINGVLVVSPIPSNAQADPNELLGHLLWQYQTQHEKGAALDATLPERYVHLSNSRRIADRVIWAGLGRQPDPKTDVVTIAVEFVSESKRDWYRDYIEKRQEYLAVGVKEYWVVDRFRRAMTVYTGTPDAPQERVVCESETYQTALLPGFELPLEQLLAAADKWSDNSET